MKEIWKYALEVADTQLVRIPLDTLLCVQLQNNVPTLWAIVDDRTSMMDLEVRCYGTGHGHPQDDDRYLGTVQLNGFVWHYFAAGTAFGTFNSGFLQHVSTTRLDAEAWARHHLADSPEVEIKRMTFYPAPDPPEPCEGTTPQAERPEFHQAVHIANLILDRPNADPDDDIAILARQFLRATEARAVAPVETPRKENK